MIIKIDIEILSQIAAKVNLANQLIEKCEVQLKSITEHNEWNCKERDFINEVANEIKAKSSYLRQDFNGFVYSVNSAAEHFSDAKSTILQLIRKVDISVGKTWGIESKTTVGVGSGVSSKITSVCNSLKVDNALDNYTVANITNGISICNFNTLNFGSSLDSSSFNME